MYTVFQCGEGIKKRALGCPLSPLEADSNLMLNQKPISTQLVVIPFVFFFGYHLWPVHGIRFRPHKLRNMCSTSIFGRCVHIVRNAKSVLYIGSCFGARVCGNSG